MATYKKKIKINRGHTHILNEKEKENKAAANVKNAVIILFFIYL